MDFKSDSKLFLVLLIFFFSSKCLVAQYQFKGWPEPADYLHTLQGPVKTWIMKSENGIVRKQTYAQDGTLLADEHKQAFGTSTSPFLLVPGIKKQLEKTYDKSKIKVSSDSVNSMKGMQILESHSKISNEEFTESINVFDEKGNIRMSKTLMAQKKRYWYNSLDHPEPFFDYVDTSGSLMLFKYNAVGSLIEFESYNMDPFQNFRIVYRRDSSDHLIERLSYDDLCIRRKADDNLKQILKAIKNPDFDINTIYPEYWGCPFGTSPLKETYTYDSLGRLKEYNHYFKNLCTFKANYEYDEKGKLSKEYQYIRYEHYEPFKKEAILEYDARGNIVKETLFPYREGKETVFTYQIEYY